MQSYITDQEDIDKAIKCFEKATAFKVDDSLCFGSIGNDGEQWEIIFDVDGQVLVIKEDDFDGAVCMDGAFEIHVDATPYYITPLYVDVNL